MLARTNYVVPCHVKNVRILPIHACRLQAPDACKRAITYSGNDLLSERLFCLPVVGS